MSSYGLKTFRIKGLPLIKGVIEGLVNHGQSFTFRKIVSDLPGEEYEIDVDADTPESGYNFLPTSDEDLYLANTDYGLLISK